MDYFSLKSSSFTSTTEPIVVEKKVGFAEVTECCFANIKSEKQSSVFLIYFESGSAIFSNSAISHCSSNNGSQTFEFIGQSKDSYFIGTRISIILCGYYNTPDYLHTAVARCPASFSHTNTSNSIANRESSLYVNSGNGSNDCRYLIVDSCYAEIQYTLSFYGLQTNCSFLNIINCSSTNDSILSFNGELTIENSNFLNNKAPYLFHFTGNKAYIRDCYVEGLDTSDSTKMSTNWKKQKNIFMVASKQHCSFHIDCLYKPVLYNIIMSFISLCNLIK